MSGTPREGRRERVLALPNSSHKAGVRAAGNPGKRFPGGVSLSRLPESRAGGAGARSVQRGSRKGLPIPEPRTNPDFESCGPRTGLK